MQTAALIVCYLLVLGGLALSFVLSVQISQRDRKR